MVSEQPFDPFDPSLIADPYPVYRAYRETDPVHWGPPQSADAGGCFYLFRAREIEQVLRDDRFVRRMPGTSTDSVVPDAERPFVEMSRRWLLSSDPPDHTRLRQLVNKAFTAKVADRLRGFMRRVANELLDARLAHGHIELIHDYAFAFSFAVITEILGVHVDDHDDFRRWSNAVGEGINFRNATNDTFARASEGVEALTEYFRRALHERRTGNDVLSELVAARDDSARIDDDELIAMCIQLIFAGQETTVNTIGNSVLALLRHPIEFARLRSNPELLSTAIPELIRFDAAVQTAAARKPKRDVVVGDKRIAAGQPVIAMLGSANRDPEVFPDPDALDLGRVFPRSFAFGLGIHSCLGAFLARAEATIAIAVLLERCGSITLAPGASLDFRPHAVLRGLQRLDLRIERRRPS